MGVQHQIHPRSSYNTHPTRFLNMLSLLLFVSVAAAGRLDNTYLPPFGAGVAGGNGNVLAAPNGVSDAVVPQQRYIAPAGNTYLPPSRSGPAPVYGAPNGYHNGNNGYRSADARANILRFDNENNGDGNYQFEYETENKISQHEVGQVKNVAPEGGVTVVRGVYSYVGDDGQTYTVNYIADENGFQPTGEHIHKEIQMTAADAARTAASEVGYSKGYSNGQGGYRY